MPNAEIRPFSEEHLDAAAALLRERHERHLAGEPLLARNVDYRAQIAAVDGAGVVAVRDGQVRAYLLGETTDDDAFVGFASCAAAEPELLRDLYAALAPGWERARHRVYVPAGDAALVEAWFRLAFGLQLVYGVRETAGGTAALDGDVSVRLGNADDLDATAALSNMLWEHQHGSPSFSGRRLVSLEAMREQWRGTWDDPAFAHLVAERDGRVVGDVLLFRRPENDLRVPPDNIDLAHASVAPAERGSGVGLALVEHALEWARSEGFASMTVDWREVNLLASRFWPRRGFRPTFYRLYRRIP
ncbi:MAG: GNAT family N-acetyltransferase [Gaiellaceae bacterium]